MTQADPKQSSSAIVRARLQACRRRFALPCLHVDQCRDETQCKARVRGAKFKVQNKGPQREAADSAQACTSVRQQYHWLTIRF